jgi:FKBP-type peptidyl-prolyl cis-trans isomerase
MCLAARSCLVAVVLCACSRAPAPAPAPAEAKRPAPATNDVRPPPDLQPTPSGLRSVVLRRGTGDRHPQPHDLVEIHFTGWRGDGTEFDSSYGRNAPNQFVVQESIKGWSEALQSMVVGEKRRVWVPPSLAYGDKPNDRLPPGLLVFDLELLKLMERPKPLPAPADLEAPPPKKTASGLAYRVLTKGTGRRHPGPDSVVEVHYTGWGPDGRMLDSSVVRGQPMRMQLNNAGKAWIDALRPMVEGQKTRFWIPPAMTTSMGISAPRAVYDVELIAIH